MIFSKKRTLIPLTLIILCLVGRGLLLQSMQTYPLAQLCETLTLDMLQDNPFELHYSIAYPEALKLKDLSTNLIPFSETSYESGHSVWEARKKTLEQINPDHLSSENAFLHRLLTNHVDLQLKSLEFPYYENPLSGSGGVHSQLPILLSEYAFRCKEDVENYFVLLSQIPAYLDGIGQYAALQEQKGLPLYIGSLRRVQTQCLELFPAAQLKNNTHFLQTSFQSRLQTLVEQGLLSPADADAFRLQNDTLLTEQLVPAYKALAAALGGLKGSSAQAGLSAYPQGQAYYTLLLRSSTGSSKSVEELRALLYERYDQLYKDYITLLQKDAYITNWQPALTEPEQMLQHLYTQSLKSFPSLEKLSPKVTQQVQLKKVDGLLADMSAPAFYMTPPIDANTEHTIYINPNADLEALDLYTTLAHEGFPGHLYQTAYSQTSLLQNRVPLLRQLLYYGGFTEGWAVYAELFSYDFLTTASTDASGTCDSKEEATNNAANLGTNEALTNTLLLARYNREIQLCLCSILDIYIHYDGASSEQVQELLKTLGLNTASAANIYSTICESPANYPKYYVGYLEILELKNAAKELWGDNYSDYEFHKWLLETGGGDFGSLRAKLEQDSK